MILTLNIKNTENIGTPNIQRYEKIVSALISSGGLDGVKGGKTVLHFDQQGTFQKIQLDYYPYIERNPQG